MLYMEEVASATGGLTYARYICGKHAHKWLVNDKGIYWIRTSPYRRKRSSRPERWHLLLVLCSGWGLQRQLFTAAEPSASAGVCQIPEWQDTFKPSRYWAQNTDPLSAILSYVRNAISSAVRLFVKRLRLTRKPWRAGYGRKSCTQTCKVE